MYVYIIESYLTTHSLTTDIITPGSQLFPLLKTKRLDYKKKNAVSPKFMHLKQFSKSEYPIYLFIFYKNHPPTSYLYTYLYRSTNSAQKGNCICTYIKVLVAYIYSYFCQFDHQETNFFMD